MRLDRRVLYALATNKKFEALVRRSPVLSRAAYGAARRYVAGQTLADVLVTAEALAAEGLAVSIDRFGEGLDDGDDLDHIVAAYVELAAAVADREVDAYLEVVPSHLGIDISIDAFCQQARRIAVALPAGARLHISAEESWRTPAIVDAVVALGREGVAVMATVQANLRRSPEDADRLIEAGVPVRLVKGAYLEPADAAYAWGEQTDVAFVALAHQLREGGVELALGTHDPVLRDALLAGRPDIGVEMLLGIRPDDARTLVRQGRHVRIYVPYGGEWFRYWMRRIAEARGT